MVRLYSMTTIRGSRSSERSRSPNVEPAGIARASPFTWGAIVSSGAARVFIPGKIVDRGPFGIARVPDPANRGHAVRPRAPQGGDVLWTDPTDRDARDPG